MKTETLTVSEAFEEHYVSDELGKGTQTSMRSSFKLWEKFTDNPSIDQITNATAAQFRQAAIDSGLAPDTINTAWRQIRTVLRRVGPVTDGNPWAMEMIPRVPAMRPIPVPFKRPRRLSMEELSRLYLAARHMKFPARNVPNPAFWWQALIVVAYFTGLRVSDLLKIKWADLNGKDGTLFVKTSKTGVEADLPLPPVALAHLDRLEKRGGRIFDIYSRRFYLYMRDLKAQAKLEEFKGFHDIRRTACSEAERVRQGMGKVLLLHAANNVTERSYLNSLPELREVVEGMEVPDAFRHGPKMIMRAIREARKVVTIRPTDFTVPVHPPKELFGFTSTGIAIAGRFLAASPMRRNVIRTFIENEGTATQPQLWEALYGTPFPGGSATFDRLQLMRDLSSTRQFLRRELRLPTGFNPIVATETDRARDRKMCKYEFFLPPALWQPDTKGGQS